MDPNTGSNDFIQCTFYNGTPAPSSCQVLNSSLQCWPVFLWMIRSFPSFVSDDVISSAWTVFLLLLISNLVFSLLLVCSLLLILWDAFVSQLFGEAFFRLSFVHHFHVSTWLYCISYLSLFSANTLNYVAQSFKHLCVLQYTGVHHWRCDTHLFYTYVPHTDILCISLYSSIFLNFFLFSWVRLTQILIT